jgi:phosphatidylglycerol:prolipoprotein diacylglycerol transferase
MLAYWVHHFDPFLVRFSGNFGIRYYGLAYVLGFLAAAWLLRRYTRAGRSTLAGEDISDLIVAIVMGVLIGGRLGYFLFYQPGTLAHNPLQIVKVWEGGMASHGGFIGVTLALWWFAAKHQIRFAHVSDLIASAAPVGLLFGRIANFINGELPGKVTTVAWAWIFPNNEFDSKSVPLPRHPSQLYEAALEGALLLALVQWRFWKTDVVRTRPGRLAGEFLIAYAVVRMVCEIFREPDASLVFGLSRGTFYSIFLIAAGVVLIVRARPTTEVLEQGAGSKDQEQERTKRK